MKKTEKSIEKIKTIFDNFTPAEIQDLRNNYIQKCYLKNERFLDAIKSKHEIMINCNNYYALE